MKRASISFLMLLAVISISSALAEAEHEVSMTMELHRLPNHNIHPERYARRLSIEDDAPELVPLHLGLGTHYTWIYAGTPPQRASVIVDTGSALMAFPCSGCDGCGNHTDQPFLADNSSTLVHVTCSHESFFHCTDCRVTTNTCAISQSYMEGSSWKATVVEDVVYLGGESSFQDMAMRDKYGTHFQFGCQSSETGLFVTQVADGIMGLSNTDNHIIAKLHHENKIPSNLFSLCFIENGGTMSIGQPHKLAHRGEISYVKLIPDRSTRGFYNVHMKEIRIGGKSINAKEEAFTHGHYIVDSGTTDSYLPRSLKTEFLEMFKEVAGRDYQVGQSCKGYTNEDLSSLPAIQFVMEAYGDENGEVVLDIPPEQYLIRAGGLFCGDIYLSENSGGVIGANLMMNRDVIFDIGNQRVGFVDADCAYQEAPNSTVVPFSNKTTSISEGKEKEKGTVAIAVVPSATSAVADIPAPTAGVAPAVPTSEPTLAAITSAPTAGAAPAVPTSEPTLAAIISKKKPAATTASTVDTTSDPTSVPVTPEPTTTAAATPVTTMTMNISSLNAASSAVDSTIETLSRNTTTMPLSSSSAAMGDSNSKEKSSGTHPLVLTIVGTVLVVGFLVMMLISVSRLRQKTGKDQLWSRVKGDEEGEEDDDEEEFGHARNDKKNSSTKHQRLGQEEDDDDDHQSSSDEEDEVFDQKSMQDESNVDNRTLERL